MSNNFRCVICNKVNNLSIMTEVGDFLPDQGKKNYIADYKYDDAHICYVCEEVIQETLHEYHIYDMEKDLEAILMEDEDLRHGKRTV